jgi:hypothetical protein
MSRSKSSRSFHCFIASLYSISHLHAPPPLAYAEVRMLTSAALDQRDFYLHHQLVRVEHRNPSFSEDEAPHLWHRFNAPLLLSELWASLNRKKRVPCLPRCVQQLPAEILAHRKSVPVVFAGYLSVLPMRAANFRQLRSQQRQLQLQLRSLVMLLRAQG